jgi:hydroxymethylbilane synthase
LATQLLEKLLDAINHTPSWIAGEAERGFLRAIEGGCQVPVGCYSQTDGEKITLTGFVASMDGSVYLLDNNSGSATHPKETGEKLAQKLIKRGASKIMEEIRNNDSSASK